MKNTPIARKTSVATRQLAVLTKVITTFQCLELQSVIAVYHTNENKTILIIQQHYVSATTNTSSPLAQIIQQKSPIETKHQYKKEVGIN